MKLKERLKGYTFFVLLMACIVAVFRLAGHHIPVREIDCDNEGKEAYSADGSMVKVLFYPNGLGVYEAGHERKIGVIVSEVVDGAGNYWYRIRLVRFGKMDLHGWVKKERVKAV